jgi:hypothetical protein
MQGGMMPCLDKAELSDYCNRNSFLTAKKNRISTLQFANGEQCRRSTQQWETAMFGFSHPRPPSRKEVAMQIMQQEARTFSATELTVDLPDNPVVAPPPIDAPIRFEVAYTAREYRAFVREHLAFRLRHASAQERRVLWDWPLAIALGAALLAWLAGPGWLRDLAAVAAALAVACLPFMAEAWVTLVATPVFYMKKQRMPLCAFQIDVQGIERTTRQGRLVWRWNEVQSVRRYRHGYLLAFAGGAIPLPFRCMTAQQQERLRALILGVEKPARA